MSNFSFGYVPGKLTGINSKAEDKTQTVQANTVQTPKQTFLNKYELKKLKAEVLAKVSVPMYFKEVIVPQLPGYFDVYPVNFDVDPRACCPLHDEDTPSFRYYEDTHSFYCFGCQKGGTVINLHRYFAERLNNRHVDDDEAVSYLYNYFIRGKNVGYIDDVKPVVEDPAEIKKKKTDEMKFSAYKSTFEKTISFDKNISDEDKLQLWHTADVVDALMSIGIITPNNAKEYIEHEVKRLLAK